MAKTKNKSHMLQIRLTPGEFRAVRAAARHRGVGVSELVRLLVGRDVQRTARAKAVNA